MSEIPQIGLVEQRVKLLAPTLSQIFERRRQIFELQESSKGRLELIDPNLSELSEMPICRGLRYLPSIPTLFDDLRLHYAQGLVCFPNDPTYPDPIEHEFYANDSEILCLFPGQFVDFGKIPEYKGAKLDILQKQAPHLVTRYDYGIATLYGNRGEIMNTLGLGYVTDEEMARAGFSKENDYK